MKWQPMTKEYSAEQRKLPKKLTCMATLGEAERDFKEIWQWLE